MKKVFDELTIKNLKARETMYACMAENEPGFGVRVYPSGTKTFFYQYKIDGQRRFMSLGDYPAMSLKKARAEYMKSSLKVKDLRRGSADGADPAKEIKLKAEIRIREENERLKAPAVDDLVNEYIERHAKKKKRSWQKDEAILNRDVVPAWGKRKAKDIAKKDVIALLDGIVDRGAPAMANNCFQIIRKMFNWAAEKDILTTTPCLGVKLPSEKNTRDRALSESETRTLWNSLERDDLCMSLDARRALRLILVTAQRPGEVIGMHTSEIDGDWWTIPKERAKNGRAHRVYLTGLALDLIGPLEVADDETGEMKPKGYIFPTPISQSKKRPGEVIVKPMGDTALAVTVGRNLAYPLTDKAGNPLFNKDGTPATENRLGVDKFTPHDLRRTANTLMAASKVIKEHRERVLNHTLEKLDGTYNQYDYDPEKQAALEKLEGKIKIILAGDKVVDLDTRRKERKSA